MVHLDYISRDFFQPLKKSVIVLTKQRSLREWRNTLTASVYADGQMSVPSA
jgi:hypothetical protein